MTDAARLVSVPELARMLDAHADSLARDLLPNGRQEGAFWRTSNVSDVRTGSYSLAVNLANHSRPGLWTDFGACEGMADRSGDMLKLVALTRFGGDLGDACRWARSFLGLDGLDPERLATRRAEVSRLQKKADEDALRTAKRMRRMAQALFLDPRAVAIAGTPAELYLAGRGIDLSLLDPCPRGLRYHPAVWCSEVEAELPALVAVVLDMEGRHAATHRTWIKPDSGSRPGRAWSKADLENPKKCLGSFWGGYIPLWKGASDKPLHRIAAGTPVAMSEGIEDGLTVACACPELRVIAAVTLGNMAAIALPPPPGGPGTLTMIGQRDKPGSQAARALDSAIVRQRNAGREVRLALPPIGIKDANDLARAPALEGAA